MLSVIIPVWRESSLLDNLISDLAKDPYKDKEIIVTIDEPTSKSKTLVQKYADVKFLLNENRMGKVNALNEASQLANGDLLMFLDADTTLKTKNILSKVEQQMDSTVDILEFKKEVEKENFISKLVSYDYIGGIVCSLLFNRLKRCLGLNGSGFVITRQFFNEVGGFKNVISEDLEMGMQAFLRSKTYKYAKDIAIYQQAPSNWKTWFTQRKRWALGTSQLFRSHKKEFIKMSVKHPQISLVALYFFFPALISVMFMSPLVDQAILVGMFALSVKFPILFPILFLTTWGLLLVKNLTVFATMYAVSSVLFYITSRKLKLDFSNREFLVYYLFYSPVWFAMFASYFLIGLFKKNIQLSDWKIK